MQYRFGLIYSYSMRVSDERFALRSTVEKRTTTDMSAKIRIGAPTK
jgi:hypothetical protein